MADAVISWMERNLESESEEEGGPGMRAETTILDHMCVSYVHSSPFLENWNSEA